MTKKLKKEMKWFMNLIARHKLKIGNQTLTPEEVKKIKTQTYTEEDLEKIRKRKEPF